eukprot:366246-Chlamydomonas_euryale.AAC.2
MHASHTPSTPSHPTLWTLHYYVHTFPIPSLPHSPHMQQAQRERAAARHWPLCDGSTLFTPHTPTVTCSKRNADELLRATGLSATAAHFSHLTPPHSRAANAMRMSCCARAASQQWLHCLVRSLAQHRWHSLKGCRLLRCGRAGRSVVLFWLGVWLLVARLLARLFACLLACLLLFGRPFTLLSGCNNFQTTAAVSQTLQSTSSHTLFTL